jgi:hypothetical protein
VVHLLLIAALLPGRMALLAEARPTAGRTEEALEVFAVTFPVRIPGASAENDPSGDVSSAEPASGRPANPSAGSDAERFDPLESPLEPQQLAAEPQPLEPSTTAVVRQTRQAEVPSPDLPAEPSVEDAVGPVALQRNAANLATPTAPPVPNVPAPAAAAPVVAQAAPETLPIETTAAAPELQPQTDTVRRKTDVSASTAPGNGGLTAPRDSGVTDASSDSPPLASPVAGRRSDPKGEAAGAPVAPIAGAGALAGLRPSRAVTVSPAPRERLAAPDESDVSAAVPAIDTSDAAGSRRGSAAAGLPARDATAEAAGGLGTESAPGVGSPLRRAQTESSVARVDKGPLLGRRSSGPVAIDGRSREPAAAFARRGDQRQKQGLGGEEAADGSAAAIDLGLDYLARQQMADGSWSLGFASPRQGDTDEQPSFRSDSAATGLALLSFLGAGYDHYGGRHEGVVQRALGCLLKQQKPDGDLYRPQDARSNESAWLYSHGIASIALCEAYGMTGDRSLAGPAQKAVDFIVASQDPAQGAWRYRPQVGSDTSVSGWQLMALKSGELAGLRVPAGTYEKTRHWLDGAQAEGSQYVYNPLAPDTPAQRHGRKPTSTMTAVGLLMRLYTGWNRDDPRMIAGAEHLLQHLPEQGTAARPARDTYYWYYATQVMFHMRGKYWRAWNERLNPLLIDQQIQSGPLAGSWDPRRPAPDRWGPQGGRIYVTTLNLLSLEVFYRHLPIYESTAK